MLEYNKQDADCIQNMSVVSLIGLFLSNESSYNFFKIRGTPPPHTPLDGAAPKPHVSAVA